jgi:hypothetical protein
MAAKGNSCFWLANVKKIFSSETAGPNGAKQKHEISKSTDEVTDRVHG